MLDNIVVESLQERFQGEIIRPSDAGYDDARTIWNAMIDKYPALIARCTNSDDVIEAVNFARDNNLLEFRHNNSKSEPDNMVGQFSWNLSYAIARHSRRRLTTPATATMVDV